MNLIDKLTQSNHVVDLGSLVLRREEEWEGVRSRNPRKRSWWKPGGSKHQDKLREKHGDKLRRMEWYGLSASELGALAPSIYFMTIVHHKDLTDHTQFIKIGKADPLYERMRKYGNGHFYIGQTETSNTNINVMDAMKKLNVNKVYVCSAQIIANATVIEPLAGEHVNNVKVSLRSMEKYYQDAYRLLSGGKLPIGSKQD